MPSSASQAMQTLTQQWYNAVTTGLNLRGQFQMVQGNIAVGATSQALWTLMDTVPPDSLTQFWTPGSYNSFASNYGSVLSRIHSNASGSFQTAMGDYYNTWMTYLKSNPPAPPIASTLPPLFQSWAYANMSPEQAQSCYTALQATLIDPIGAAQQMWITAGGQGGVKAYGTTIETLDSQIAMAPSGNASLNSQTSSSDVSHTWANGSVDGFFDIFFGKAGASYDATTSVVTNAGVDITVQFQHVATIPVTPLETGSVTAGPTTYPSWYVPAALQTGYNNNNYQIWQPGSPDWNSFFGATGSMQRGTSGLVVVDGIKITVTSLSSIAEADRQQVQASFEAGFFPFFGVSGSGGWSNAFSFNDSGEFVASSSCPIGNPQVLGILVTPIANLIAQTEVMNAVRNRRTRAPVRALPAPPAPEPLAARTEAPMVATIAWTGIALQGLHNLGVSPPIEQLIATHVTNWAQNNGPHWALNSLHAYQSAVPAYTATAQVVAVNGPDRTLNIVNFV